MKLVPRRQKNLEEQNVYTWGYEQALHDILILVREFESYSINDEFDYIKKFEIFKRIREESYKFPFIFESNEQITKFYEENKND